MTAKDNKCECCGNIDLGAGVACIPMVPMSIYWCEMCIAMKAVPKWAGEDMYEGTPYYYYNKEYDCYVDSENGHSIIIQFKDGMKFVTRREASEYLKELRNVL